MPLPPWPGVRRYRAISSGMAPLPRVTWRQLVIGWLQPFQSWIVFWSSSACRPFDTTMCRVEGRRTRLVPTLLEKLDSKRSNGLDRRLDRGRRLGALRGRQGGATTAVASGALPPTAALALFPGHVAEAAAARLYTHCCWEGPPEGRGKTRASSEERKGTRSHC